MKRRRDAKKRELIIRNALENISMGELLERRAIDVNIDKISSYIKDKVILVTGAGGSIGSELCRQISRFEPRLLLLLGHGENSVYNIEKELSNHNKLLKMRSLIADIQDKKRLEDIFSFYRPQIIFHAAAHKHVPLMELNPSEAIKNNVWGTKNLADCAQKHEAECFIFISSDKAVNSTSIMGTSKRLAEIVLQTKVKDIGTRFVTVRFGNVLGSRGSVLHLFKEQIIKGGPVTVTHPEMVRYFMTIPEAVQLVIQAGAMAKGGEIFILDMGNPVKIIDLAHKLISLAGLKLGKDIQIVFTGMRPGEKLVEEILTERERVRATYHDHIYISDPSAISEELEVSLREFENFISLHDSVAVAEIFTRIRTLFPELYQPQPSDMDSSRE
ncbi:UDP-N-acetylglucosamine 4,6-dehydratase family protein [Paenibacillus sp. NPDC058910]|uniref:UDP-N-acetylglucosamine 4,6-dehydratase family protein n=1 Tax=unclassified Paenibacillus TaxID=185978 RepID=UPI00368E0602